MEERGSNRATTICVLACTVGLVALLMWLSGAQDRQRAIRGEIDRLHGEAAHPDRPPPGESTDRVFVTVTGPTGEAVADAKLELRVLDREPGARVATTKTLARTRTDTTGCAYLPVPRESAERELVVRAAARGCLPALARVVERNAHIALTGGVDVRGTVWTSGHEPVGGIDVVAIPSGLPVDAPSRGVIVPGGPAWSRETTSDKGEFTFTLSPEADYELRAQAPGWIQPISVTVDPRSPDNPVSLVVFPAREFRLRLLDKTTGQPIRVPFVQIRPNDPSVKYHGFGSGWIQAMPSPQHSDFYIGVVWWEGTAKATEELELSVSSELAYRPARATVSLRPMGSAAKPDEVALVRLNPDVGSLTVHERASMTLPPISEGRFLRVSVGGKWKWNFFFGRALGGDAWAFDNLPAGRFQVALKIHVNVWSEPATAQLGPAGRTPVVVHYPPWGEVSIHATNKAGNRLTEIEVELREYDPAKRKAGKMIGRFLARDGRPMGLAPGSYHFTLYLPGFGPEERSVTIAAHEKVRLDVPMSR